MNKFSGRSIRLIIVALVAGLLTPVTVAMSVDPTITKTFTVRAANDSLLANAKVQLSYINAAGAKVRITAVNTNSSGVAAVQAPQDAPNLTYDIIPAAGDVTNAAIQGNLSSSADESIAVKLQTANFVVDIQGATGGAAPVGAIVQYPTGDGSSNARISPIRTGAFGLRIATNFDTSKVYQIRLLQYVNEYAAGEFSYSYGIKGAGASGAQTYTVYTDTSASTVLSPTSSVYVLQYDAATVNGTIKKADGTALILPNGSDLAWVSLRPFATNTGTPAEASSNFPVSPTGSQFQWSGRSRGTPGKYTLAATFPGQLTTPSFYEELWKNSSNGFGFTESGPFTSAPHVLDLRLPSRGVNFALKYVLPGTTTPANYSWSLTKSEVISGQTNGMFKMGANGGANGQTALSLADGVYKFQIDRCDDSGNCQTYVYSLDVTNSVSVLKDSFGSVIAKPSDGVYIQSPTPANIKIKVVSAANPSTVIQNANVELYNGADGTGSFIGGRGTGTTTADATLPDGTYFARISGGNEWANYGNVEKVVTVTGGVATIAGLTKDSNGVYTIGLPTKNFKFTLIEGSAAMLGWVTYCVLDSSNNQTSCWGEGVNQNGEGGLVLQNSTNYRIYVNPPSSSTSSRSTYNVTVNSSGAITVSPNEVANSRYILRPASANVAGTLVTVANSVESNLTFANNQGVDLQVQKKDVKGNFNWYGMSAWRNTNTWSFNFTEVGTYRILANPQGFTDYAWSYSSEFYVLDVAGVKKFSTDSATDASPKTTLTGSDALKIIVRAANLKLRTINPQTNELMKYGWASIFKKETDRETWVMNADLTSNNPGISGANLSDGNYRLEVNPMYNGSNIAGLTKKNYDVNVNGNTITVSYNGTNIAAVDGRVTITPASSNITAKIVDASGTALKPGNNQWVSVNLQKLNTATNNYDWTNNWSNTDKDGFISMTVTDAGTYRLRIEPNGYASSTITTTAPFTVAAGSESTFNKAFGDIALGAPSLRVKVTLPNSTTPINFAGVEIRKNNNWLDWSGTGPQGIANIAFTEEGTFQIVVNPQQEQLNAGATRKTYDVVVTKNSAGAFVGVVTGITPVDGIYSVALGSGNVSGSVYAPGNGTTAIANAQVVAINTVTGQEMWEYSTNSTSTGKFSMNLPNGVYKIMARAPWGTNSYGGSDQIGTVTVAASGVTVANGFAGLTGTTLVVRLKDPAWKGTVRTPSDVADAVVPYAQVCLWNDNRWDCTTANEQGQWSLSAPDGFTAFSSNAAFEIGDVRNRLYPSIRVNGAADVLALIGAGGTSVPSGANTTTSQTLVNRFNSANVKVTVTAGGVVQPNVWVTLDRPGVGWLGGNSTNSLGVASFSVDLSNVSASAINARVEFNGNQNLTGRYAPTMIEFSGADVVTSKGSGSVANLSVSLLTPNFNAVVTQTASNLSPVQWSWVELFDDATNQWKGGSNTDLGGEFAMNITRPTSGDPYQYTMVVNPPWNATGSVSKRTYTVTVPITGDITLKDKNTGTSIAKTGVSPNTYFPMTLGTPSVSGTVVSGTPEATVQDSRVTPINATTGEWLWQQGQNTKANGAFGLGLSDGNYKIQADVPWGVTGLTRSAQCAVTVTGGAITSAGTTCNASGGVIKLTLRQPNLKMTLVQNGVGVAYAHVGIGIGNWSTDAQADAQGRISLFVDREAIMAANPGLTGMTDIRVWVDPPYGNSSMVRWDCNSGDANKPVCSTMADFNPAADYTPVDLGNVTVQGPNTKFKIVLPNTNAAPAGSWISILSFVPSVSCCNWIGGGQTDASGNVSFNIETATVAANVRYKIEVNPRWEDRAIYSQKVYDNAGAGYTVDELNALNRSFAIGSPNVVLTVRGADIGNSANKWGNVNIFEVNPATNETTNWVGGYGLDTLGKVALILAPNKRYRIAAFPGGGITGTRSWCYVDTSNASESNTVLSVVAGMCGSTTIVGANNALTITLNAGNITGTVKTNGVAVEGAIVYANLVGATNQDNAVTTTTNSLGKFGLLLDPAKGPWQISIFPINKPGATALKNKILDGLTPPALASSRDIGDIALVP
jgi:hypothetical protein